jgi:hypothetical protein
MDFQLLGLCLSLGFTGSHPLVEFTARPFARRLDVILTEQLFCLKTEGSFGLSHLSVASGNPQQEVVFPTASLVALMGTTKMQEVQLLVANTCLPLSPLLFGWVPSLTH